MKSRYFCYGGGNSWSPPSRGAWIEILTPLAYYGIELVAPLAGGVD